MKAQHEIFCREYLIDFNGTRAYMAAYPSCSKSSARRCAADLLTNPDIEQKITELKIERMEKLDIKTEDVLRLLWQTASADPNELVEVRRVCCRYCYGADHRYTFTPAEWENVQARHRIACEQAEQTNQPIPPEPDVKGGIHFDQRVPPADDCPECFGFGEEKLIIKDTKQLTEAGRRLYAGAKVSQRGIEILTHSRDKNLELIGRHLAMFTDNTNHLNNGGDFKPMSLAEFYGGNPGTADDDPKIRRT